MGLLALAAPAAFLIQNLGAPFSDQTVVTQTAVFSELLAEAWDEVGFWKSHGIPMLGPVGRTVAERHPYLHHPPVGWWPPYLGRQLLGRRPAGYRLLPSLFTALGALLLSWLLAREMGRLAGLLGELLFLAAPLIQRYGAMPNMEPLTLLVSLLFTMAWLRWKRQKSRGRLLVMLLLFLAGTQVEWVFYLLVPGLFLLELLEPRPQRSFCAQKLLLAAGILGFAVVVTHMSLGTGSPGMVARQLGQAVGAVTTEGVEGKPLNQVPESNFLEAQARWIREDFGAWAAPAAALILLLILLAPSWRRRLPAQVALLFLVQALLAVVLFNGASATHGYYWYPAVVSYVMILTLAGFGWGRATARGWRLLPTLLLLAVAGWGLHEVWPDKRNMEDASLLAPIGKNIDAIFGAQTCVATVDMTLQGAMLYSQRRFCPPSTDPRVLKEILRARDRGQAAFRGFVFLLTPRTAKAWPKLADFLNAETARRGRKPVAISGFTIYRL